MIGDVVFFRKTNSLVSKIIANITKSEFTHVGLIVDYNFDTNMATIVESNRFISTRIVEIQLNSNHVIYTTGKKPKEVEDCIVNFAIKKVGTKYDYLQIFGLFISLFFKRGRDSYFNNKNKLICSELIDLAYFRAGVKRKNLDNIGNITPQELLEMYELKECGKEV